MSTSLPTDSDERKTYPLFRGLFGYFGAALAGVAHHSWKSNDKHNKGKPLHWSINQSTDHADCIMRHLVDLSDKIAEYDRMAAQANHQPANELIDLGGPEYFDGMVDVILSEADALAWRALALSQTLRMRYRGAPLPFNAKE